MSLPTSRRPPGPRADTMRTRRKKGENFIAAWRRRIGLIGLSGALTLPILFDGTARGQTPDFAPQRASCEAQGASGVPQARLAVLARGFNLTGWLDGANTRRP